VSGLYEVVHHLEELIRDATGALGGILAWSVNTAASAVLGLLVGATILAVLQLVTRQRNGAAHH